MTDFRQLKVCHKAHQLVVDVYAATATLPSEERHGLTSQVRRAGICTPANIAEGCGRGPDSELAHFLQIATGSASELEYHLLLTRALNLLKHADHGQLAG